MSIIALVVTFEPELNRLKENIRAIQSQVDKVLIIDNNSENIKQIEEYINILFTVQVEIIKNELNIGIAGALKQGVIFAKKNFFNYILTLDQDSIVDSMMVNHLIKGFKLHEKIALVAPRVYDLNSQILSDTLIENEYEYIDLAITSGSLCDVNKIVEVGNFDEKLFIDYVDFEMCYRLKNQGYEILLSKNAIINHELGKAEKKKFLWKTCFTTNHSPIRLYYWYRNRIYCLRKYRGKNKIKMYNEVIGMSNKFIKVIFLEKRKFIKIMNIFKGIYNGFKME